VILAVGATSVGLGGWLLASRYHDFDYQLQGKCDFRPCVTSADLPTVALLVGLLVLGFFLIGIAASALIRRR
jgi:hypothetical protein